MGEGEAGAELPREASTCSGVHGETPGRCGERCFSNDEALTWLQEKAILQCVLATPALGRKAACTLGSPTFTLNVVYQHADAADSVGDEQALTKLSPQTQKQSRNYYPFVNNILICMINMS